MSQPEDQPGSRSTGNGQVEVELDDHERQVNAAIRELIEAREAGTEPDRQAWLARYPDLASELAAYLQINDQVHWLVHTVVPAEPASGVRFGPYRIVRVLGKGGMGVVYEVEEEQPGTGRRLALKILPTCGLADPEARERFRREAEALPASTTQYLADPPCPATAVSPTSSCRWSMAPTCGRSAAASLASPGNPASDQDRASRPDRPPSSWHRPGPGSPDDRAELGGPGSCPRPSP